MSPATAAEQTGLSQRTTYRALRELVAADRAIRVARGRYATSAVALESLSPSARSIHDILRRQAVDAHLTAWDVVAAHTHQFTFAAPHVVYAEPAVVSSLEWLLAQEGFTVVPAGRVGARVTVGDPNLKVIVRAQADAPRRFGVFGWLAPPEKAWVDLLREARRSEYPISPEELGQMLRSLLDAGAAADKVRRYMDRLGYAGWLDGIRNGHADDDLAPIVQRISAGYRS